MVVCVVVEAGCVMEAAVSVGEIFIGFCCLSVEVTTVVNVNWPDEILEDISSIYKIKTNLCTFGFFIS